MKSEEGKQIVYFIRHGETEWNAAGKLQGHADIPLNEKGRAQAKNLAMLLNDIPFHKILSSDLSRAKETAEIINSNFSVPLVTSPQLRERHVGKIEGILVKEFDDLYAHPFFMSDIAKTKESYLDTPWHEEMESSTSVYNRVINFIQSEIEEEGTGIYLVSTHGGVLRTLLDHLDYQVGRRKIVSNCSYVKVSLSEKDIRILETYGISDKFY